MIVCAIRVLQSLSCSDSVDLLCFSFDLIIFYFIGIAVILNNEIFTNNHSMSLGNRPGTQIDAGSYTCCFDNSLLNSTNHTRFNMEDNRHDLIVCY